MKADLFLSVDILPVYQPLVSSVTLRFFHILCLGPLSIVLLTQGTLEFLIQRLVSQLTFLIDFVLCAQVRSPICTSSIGVCLGKVPLVLLETPWITSISPMIDLFAISLKVLLQQEIILATCLAICLCTFVKQVSRIVAWCNMP